MSAYSRSSGVRSATALLAATVTLVAATTIGGTTGVAGAVDSPGVDPAALPPPGMPGPEQAMKQSFKCTAPVTVAQPDVKLPAPGFAMLNIERAWQFSTGAGVTVGVIDTGVTPNPRLPRLYPGGTTQLCVAANVARVRGVDWPRAACSMSATTAAGCDM